MTWFVDTNIFIRYLANDDPAKASAVEALLAEAEAGKVELLTSEAIVAEIAFVLSSSTYGMSRRDIATSATALLAIPNLRCLGGRAVLAAFDLYAESNLDFEDCLAAAHAVGSRLEGIYSYDRGFDGIDGLVRREPELAQGS